MLHHKLWSGTEHTIYDYFFAIQALETPTQHVVHTFISTFWLSGIVGQ